MANKADGRAMKQVSVDFQPSLEQIHLEVGIVTYCPALNLTSSPSCGIDPEQIRMDMCSTYCRPMLMLLSVLSEQRGNYSLLNKACSQKTKPDPPEGWLGFKKRESLSLIYR